MKKHFEAAAAAAEAIEHDLECAWAEYPEVPESVRVQLAIAVAEVVGNIIEHGGGQHRPVCIEMALTVTDTGQVQICFSDNGDELPAAVDLEAVSMPDPIAERGRGLPLALAVLEQLSYRRDTDNAINHWTLLSRP